MADPTADRLHGETRGKSYWSALNVYLRKHHGLTYFEIPCALWPAILLKAPGLHFISGRTVRSATNGDKRHLVVGRYGETIWDPHPSRAGLLDEPLGDSDRRLFMLVPFPASWVGTWDTHSEPCECPACGGASKPRPGGAAP